MQLIKTTQYIKTRIERELWHVDFYPERWWNWCKPEDNKKRIENLRKYEQKESARKRPCRLVNIRELKTNIKNGYPPKTPSHLLGFSYTNPPWGFTSIKKMSSQTALLNTTNRTIKFKEFNLEDIEELVNGEEQIWFKEALIEKFSEIRHIDIFSFWICRCLHSPMPFVFPFDFCLCQLFLHQLWFNNSCNKSK